MLHNTKNILFLHRVFKKNCIDVAQHIENKLLDIDNKSTEIEENLYDSIPEKFTTLNEWKKQTNLLCWACDAKFSNIPVFIPEYLIETSKNITMKVLGNFCGFSCASQYNSIYTSGQCKWERDVLLRKLYRLFYNEEIKVIPCSPSKTDMIQYGGFLTREQYDDAIEYNLKIHKKITLKNSIDNIVI